jgi:hypothetical protein
MKFKANLRAVERNGGPIDGYDYDQPATGSAMLLEMTGGQRLMRALDLFLIVPNQ